MGANIPEEIDLKKWKYYEPIFEYEDNYGSLGSGWIGHRYFAYDLIRNLQPKLIVELGTFKGASLFSFAQAIKDGGLDSVLYGIDSWRGDKHAGGLNENDYELVDKIAKEIYGPCKIRLLKMMFDEAVDKFEPLTIDILHIDGLHTYEAVTSDFELWINKVKKNGIVLIHDTHETKSDFGVYRLWDKLQKKYPTIDFFHEHGLGALSFNKLVPVEIARIWVKYYSLRHSLFTAFSLPHISETKLKEKIEELTQVQNQNNDLLKQNHDLRAIIENIQRAKVYKLWQKYNTIKKRLTKSN